MITDTKKLRKYGLSVDDFTVIAEAQQHACAICTIALNYTKPHGFHIDHCHDTGTVRGLLCATCNKFLGYLEKRAEALPKYLDYIKNPPFSVGLHWTASPTKYASHAHLSPTEKHEVRLAQQRAYAKKRRAAKKLIDPQSGM